jgi:hypothetical protein
VERYGTRAAPLPHARILTAFGKRLAQSPYRNTTSKFAFIAEYQIYRVFDIERAVQSLQQGVDFRESID